MTEIKLKAPIARKEAVQHEIHNDLRVDFYHWMRLSDEQKKAEEASRDDQTKEVMQYLQEENAYTDAVLSHTADFQEKLYNEIVGRIKQTDMSVPVKIRGHWYYTRYEEGKEYPFVCRKKETLENEELIMLNGPELAKDHEYFSIGGTSISPDNNLLVYGVDTVSRRQYTLYFKDLTTGKLLSDTIVNTTGSATWANDNQTIFYTRKDPQTLRSYRIYKHKLGTDSALDEVVYEEKDETFSCFVYKTKSRKYIMIGSSATMSSEYRYLDADVPDGEFTMVQKRERELEYGVAHYEDHFYIATNLEAKNFRLMKTPVATPDKSHWKEVIAHRDDVLLEGIEIFKDYLVIEERKAGLTHIRVKKWDGSSEYYLEFNDPAYAAYVGTNPEFDTHLLRYGYTSMTTPNSTFSFNLETKEQELLKQQEVIDASFAVENYTSERLMVKATDGTEIPVSLVYRKGLKKDGSNPCVLYGYGSYGHSLDAYFSSVRLSLLDRGFVYAIAHIRGGQEMGRLWYEDGKLLKKKNTFTDFIACGEHLINQRFTSSKHLYAMGGSAGGLLVGTVMNMRPDLWNGVVASVPFVDVVNTMLDETIPLTTGEFDEWGNPKKKEYYEYIKSYSPYDNVESKDYPNLLVTTGYWDSQVQYWEPAKWVARLRALKTNNNQLLFKTNMDAGHGGASGRFRQFRETALEFAFLFDLEGIVE